MVTLDLLSDGLNDSCHLTGGRRGTSIRTPINPPCQKMSIITPVDSDIHWDVTSANLKVRRKVAALR